MTTIDICSGAGTCPVFSGTLQGNEFTTKNYHDHYCNAGLSGRLYCKRWLVLQKFGQCPSNVLPNSSKSVDEIAKESKFILC